MEQLLGPCEVQRSSRLILCVSGGLDSMALLHILAGLRQKCLPALQLHVAHFNHKIRAESDEEARFVADWAAKYELPVALHEMPVADFGRKGGGNGNGSIQAWARDWRRSETVRLLREQPSSAGSGVVTAHHTDDQVETTLLKLLRGAHISRLHPILPRSECGSFVRPLLTLSKEQLRAYMVQHDLAWREDLSNQERKYKRNQVRLDLIPAMEALTGGTDSLKARMLALGQQSLELGAWLRAESRAFLQSGEIQPAWYQECESLSALPSRFEFAVDKTSRFASLASMVQSEVLHSMCSRLLGTSVDYDQMQQLLVLSLQDLDNGARTKTIRVSDDWVVVKIGRVVRFEKQPRHHAPLSEDEEQDPAATISLPRGISVTYDPKRLLVQSCGESDEIKDEQRIDLFNIPSACLVEVRYPRPGDVFQPPWRQTPMKLTDFLRGRGTPLHLRESVPVVVIENRVAAVAAVVAKGYVAGLPDDVVCLRIAQAASVLF